MRVVIASSGSVGNALVVEYAGTRLLIDAGVRPHELESRWGGEADLSLALDAILVSHAHRDHCEYARACAMHFDAPIYCLSATRHELGREADRSASPRPIFHDITVGQAFAVGALEVLAIRVPHDVPNVAFMVSGGRKRFLLAHDLGAVPQRLIEYARTCHTVCVEANYCEDMLCFGCYPSHLKDRVSSQWGHLSNRQMADFVAQLGACTRQVVLMHLSKNNNDPDKAVACARAAVAEHVELLVAGDSPLSVDVGDSAGVGGHQLSLDLD